MGKRRAEKLLGSTISLGNEVDEHKTNFVPLDEAHAENRDHDQQEGANDIERSSGPRKRVRKGLENSQINLPLQNSPDLPTPEISEHSQSPSRSESESDNDQGLDLDPLDESSTGRHIKKVIDLDTLKRADQKADKTGLIYMARIPVGMGPGKVKHLLSKWGAVNRIYLARHDEPKKMKLKKKGKEKHQSYQFKEGWIEFEDKKVARRIAELLNTRPIGGKARDRYSSELWSLKYLPKFKWSNLSDQMAVERRMREQLQRNSLEDSKKDQEWYLRMVEKNRVGDKIKQKEISRTGKLGNSTKWKLKQFKQRDLPTSDAQKHIKIDTEGDQNNTNHLKKMSTDEAFSHLI